jgi:hypothetical protein
MRPDDETLRDGDAATYRWADGWTTFIVVTTDETGLRHFMTDRGLLGWCVVPSMRKEHKRRYSLMLAAQNLHFCEDVLRAR